MPHWHNQPWQRNLSTTASGKTGAVHYVDPKYRFSGISKSILFSLEDTAKNWGCASIFLESTRTAYRFYKEHGYESDQNRGQLHLWKALR